MRDQDGVELLQGALPRLGLRWPGFRRVRRQVLRRIDRRIAELGLDGPAAYRRCLRRDPAEWSRLDAACRVTITRFHRDRGVWNHLTDAVLPALAREAAAGARALRAWSAGCASGEEPYTLALAWQFAVAPLVPGVPLEILATDVDPRLLARAREAVYPPGVLRDLPDAWRTAAFEETADARCRLRPAFRRGVTFARQDVRRETPGREFDLVLCRNLAFTYFDVPTQRAVRRRLEAALRPGGLLVVGKREALI